jgi:hypothetical protein
MQGIKNANVDLRSHIKTAVLNNIKKPYRISIESV